MIDLLNKYLTLGNCLIIVIIFLVFVFFKIKNRIKIIIPYIISIVLCLYVYEVIILKSEYTFSVNLGDYSSGRYFKKQVPNLGYGPPDDGEYTSIKLIDSDTVYNVAYSIKDKLRVTPSSNKNSENQIIFLGCSQTFGEGLNDNQTLANYFGEKTDNVFMIRNYGFHGYGPHNIHSLIKNNILPNYNQKIKTIAVYDFYWYHINRAVSNVSGQEPWYEEENGEIVLKGTFDDRDGIVRTGYYNKYYDAIRNRIIRRSNIYKKHFTIPSSDIALKNIDKHDINRTILLIEDISEMFKTYNIDFVVNIDTQIAQNSHIKNFFNENEIGFICIECDIPDINTNESYRIPLDGHNSSSLNKKKANILRLKLLSLGYKIN